MNDYHIASLQTPKKFLLQGLWLGSSKPHTVYIFVHGLGSTLFSQITLAQSLVAKDTAVLVFNNRGNGIVSGIKRITNTKKGYTRETLGAAHEVFEDCVDDLDGAVAYAHTHGAKRIILVGHSTGCQKSVYYLYKKKNSPVSGAVLLAPMSDYASSVKETPPKMLARAVAYATKLVAAGKPHELLPTSVWPQTCDAQRFLSLNTPESVEEIFSYALPKKTPRVLRSVRQPLLVVLAGEDEYGDRPAADIAQWFTQVTAKQKARVAIVPGSTHNFHGQDAVLKTLITDLLAV